MRYYSIHSTKNRLNNVVYLEPHSRLPQIWFSSTVLKILQCRVQLYSAILNRVLAFNSTVFNSLAFKSRVRKKKHNTI